MSFMSSESNFLGVDLGAGTVKLVELRNEQGRPRLVTYGSYELPLSQSIGNDWSSRERQAVEVLKLLLEQTKASSRLVISALPTFEVFSSMISIPAVEKKEFVNAIRLEAKKVVPRPLDEMILDWKEIGAAAASQESVSDENEDQAIGKITGSKQLQQKKVLITAAPKDLVDGYLRIFRDAGLKLVGLETEAIALSRSLIGRDPSVVMIADMGAKTTNLSVVEEGIAVVNRGVQFGGKDISEKMASRMAIDARLSEQWKRDIGLNTEEKQLSPALKTIMDDLLHEIEYMFHLYRSQFRMSTTNKGGIEKIVLAGGSSYVPGLAQYLATQLNVPVHLGDPWARIVYPEDLSPILRELGPSMSVAVGLAMREIVSK